MPNGSALGPCFAFIGLPSHSYVLIKPYRTGRSANQLEFGDIDWLYLSIDYARGVNVTYGSCLEWGFGRGVKVKSAGERDGLREAALRSRSAAR